jgi:hypothetical protein
MRIGHACADQIAYRWQLVVGHGVLFFEGLENDCEK